MDGPVVAEQHGDKTVHKALDRRIGIEEPGYIEEVSRVLTIQGGTHLPAIEFGFRDDRDLGIAEICFSLGYYALHRRLEDPPA